MRKLLIALAVTIAGCGGGFEQGLREGVYRQPYGSPSHGSYIPYECRCSSCEGGRLQTRKCLDY